MANEIADMQKLANRIDNAVYELLGLVRKADRIDAEILTRDLHGVGRVHQGDAARAANGIHIDLFAFKKRLTELDEASALLNEGIKKAIALDPERLG